MALPLEDLDDLRFEDLVAKAVSSIPANAPEWTDHNAHDPGITLIELYCWLAEMQLYRLNRISAASRRKMLALAGIPSLRPAEPAELEIAFDAPMADSLPLPEDTPLSLRIGASEELIELTTAAALTARKALIVGILSQPRVGKIRDCSKANDDEGSFFEPFGPQPAEGDRLLIGFDADLSGAQTSLSLTLLEDGACRESSEGAVVSSAALSWSYFKGGEDWERLKVEDGTGCLAKSGEIRFNVPGPMAESTISKTEAYWIGCELGLDHLGAQPYYPSFPVVYDSPPRISEICLNAVRGIQRSLPFDEGGHRHSGMPDFRIGLANPPILEGSLSIDKGAWTRVEDFFGSDPRKQHYRVDLNTGELRFGDGLRGLLPEEGTPLAVTYRRGGRRIVSAESKTAELGIISEAGQPSARVARVISGGRDEETAEEAIARARSDLRSVTRAVTASDFEFLALRTPGGRVARAKALPGYHPSRDGEVPGMISVIIVPQGQGRSPLPSLGLLKTVYRHLERYRLLGCELFVLSPQYVEVSVTAAVKPKSRNDAEAVEGRAERALSGFIDPIGGGAEGDGWPFGRPVYVSEIYELLDKVEGVDHVSSVTLRTNADAPRIAAALLKEADRVSIPRHALACSGSHRVHVESATGRENP